MNASPPEKESVQVKRVDLDYVRDARAVLKGDRQAGGTILLVAVVVLFASAVYWAANAEIDEVTKGQGKVIPSSSIQRVQNLEGGIVAEIFIKEGSRVKEGDVLVRIQDTQSVSSYRENLAQSQALAARLVRLAAEADGQDTIDFESSMKETRPDLVERERVLFEKRQQQMQERLSILRRSLKLASEELSMTIPLVQKGVISKVDRLRLEREVNELQGEIFDIESSLQREAMEDYNETRAELDQLQETLQGRQDRVERTLVKSPVTGTVNKLYVNTIGGVLQPGEPIVDVVPIDDTLLVETKIRPSDIAFLHPGQKATLKFSAYDFSLFGGLEGTVETISADTIQDEIDKEHYYIAKVRNEGGALEKNGKVLPVFPGMTVEVDILTGRRTVLQYLTKPFHRMRFNSLRER
ncbi:MAG: hemolysin secretion protein D [Verrucomicrobiales bacterium]|nr:hemolysin secretion protein D [Verrucomicrobiales bacterium]